MSPESVGEIWLRSVSKLMIQSDLDHFIYDIADRLQVKYTTTERTTYTFSPCGNQMQVEEPGDVITTYLAGEAHASQVDSPNSPLTVRRRSRIITMSINVTVCYLMNAGKSRILGEDGAR